MLMASNHRSRVLVVRVPESDTEGCGQRLSRCPVVEGLDVDYVGVSPSSHNDVPSHLRELADELTEL